MIRTTLILLMLLGTVAADARAQDRELSLEVNPVAGTLGYGWRISPSLMLGLDVGLGAPQLDRTLVPGDGSFLDAVHLGVFLRGQPASAITLDGRLQLGLAELRGCSGCLPGVYTGLSTGVFWGGRHVKVGPRLLAGFIIEHGDPAEFVMNVTPIAVVFTLDW